MPAMTYAFGDFELDTDKFELRKAGQIVPVEPQVFLVLKHLIENHDRMVSRDELVQQVWQGRSVSDWTTSGGIKSARNVLGDTAKDKRYIRTIHGKGFQFIALVRALPKASTPRADRKYNRGAANSSIAVLPFANLSDSTDQDYFADGIAEDLITDLFKVPGLSVVSRNASFAIKRLPADIKTIGAKLEVSHVLEGSVRRVADTLRINVNLVEAESGTQLWADRFDGSRADIFSFQDEISDRIVTSLKLHFAAGTGQWKRTSNPEAYDLCLKGRSEYYFYTPEHLAKARGYFEQAAEEDPAYAEAYAYQSYCRTAAYVFTWPGSDETLDGAIALAERAIALDDGSAVAHGRLGWVLGYLDRFDEAVASFERAVALDPRCAEVYYAYGETMNRLAKPRRALPLLEHAFSIDTFVPPSWEFAKAHSFILMRQYDQAFAHILAALERVPRFIPALVQVARAYVEAGRIDEARATVGTIREFAPKYRLMNARRMFPYPDPEVRDRFIGALRSAGLPE
jgi:TolB-like protein